MFGYHILQKRGWGRRFCFGSIVVLVLVSWTLVGCGGEANTQTCVSDSECLLKGELCRNNVCTQQASCEKDNDCKYKGEVCREKLCVMFTDNTTNPPSACPTSCSRNEQCTLCKDGRNTCVSGNCMKAERSGPYQRCGTDVGKACAARSVCSGSGGTRYCLPECDPKQKRCPDGKSTCADPRGFGTGLCIPDGEADEGAACSPTFTGETQVDTKKYCRTGLFCEGGTCKKPQEVGKYELCDNSRKCQTGMTCTALSQSAQSGYCLPSCDPQQPTCDGGKGRCGRTSNGTGVCIPQGTSKEDQKCGASRSMLKPEHFCIAGFECVGLSANGSICLKYVNQCSQNACGEGRVCLDGQQGGVCALSCKEGSNTCPNGLKCLHLHPGEGKHIDACGP